MSLQNVRFDFADTDSPLQKAIERAVSTLLPASDIPVVLFMIHGELNHRSQWEPRLAAAIQQYEPNDRLVLMGLVPATFKELAASEAFQVLLVRPRTRYADLISGAVTALIPAIMEIRQAPARELTAIELLRERRARITDTLMSYLKHDLGHTQPGTDAEKKVLDRARAAGLNGTDDELRMAVASATVTPELICRGQRFPGLFCDVEGTLLRADGSLNRRVLTYVQAAIAAGRSVTVWTGGNAAHYTNRLRGTGVMVPVVSKELFAGAQVEEVIDDRPDLLTQAYGITCERVLLSDAVP